MRQRVMRVKVVLIVAVLGMVALAGVALACTPKPEKFALDPPAAAPGEPVTVEGVAAPNAEVAIHWNSVDEAVVAETSADRSGDFSTTFEVPEQLEGGVAYVVASVDDGGGVTRAALEVTGGEQAATTAEEAWTLAPDAAAADTGSSPLSSTPLVAGMAMLTLGVVGLFGGAAAASLQRRPALARRR